MNHSKFHSWLHRSPKTLAAILDHVNNNTISLLAVILLLSVGGALALAGKDTLLGFSLLIAACVLLNKNSPRLPSPVYTLPYQPGFSTGIRRAAGIVCFAVSAVFVVQSAAVFARFKVEEVPGAVPWNQFVTGVILWVIGGLLLTRGDHPPPTVRLIPALLFIGIVGLAIFLRLYHFGSQPFGVWIDEGIAGMDGQQVLTDADFRPFFRPTTNITGINQFVYAGALKLFGQFDVHSLRLVSVFFGVGGVVLAYAVGAQLRGSWFGLIMAFFMAALYWSINFSRIAMTGIDTPFFTLLTLYFIIRLVRYGRLRDALWVGLSIGIGLWFYAGFRPLLAVLALYGIAAWRFWRPVPVVLTVVTIITTAIITLFPLGIFAMIDPGLFGLRAREVSILREENREDGESLTDALLMNIKAHLLMFHVEGDHNGRHNLPEDPMLDPVTGVLFVLGIGLSFRRLRHPAVWLFLLLFAVGLLNGILTLTYEAPHALRTIGVLPAIAYFGAESVLVIGQMLLEKRVSRPLLVAVCLVGFVVPVIYFNTTKYFIKQEQDTASWMSYSTREALIAQFARERATGQHQFFKTPLLFDQHATTLFLAPTVDDWQTLSLPDTFPLRIPATTSVTIFLGEDEGRLFHYAQTLYEDGDFRMVRPGDYGHGSLEYDPILFYLIDLSPIDIAGIQGMAGDSEGVLYAPYYSTYRFWTTPEAQLTIDGQVKPPGESIRLAIGNHALTVDRAGVMIEWGIENIRDREPVPKWALYHGPVAANGLHASLYANSGWLEPPAIERIDPLLDTYYHYLPLARPYTVTWTGWIDIPKTGEYGFGLRVITSAEIWIDSVSILQAEITGAIPVTTTVELTAGLHPIEVRFLDATDFSGLHLLWSVEGGNYVPVPREVLFPYLPQQTAGE